MKEKITDATPGIGNWNIQKRKLKAKFPALTEEDLQYETDKKDEMFEKLGVKLGRTVIELKIISGL